MPKKLRLCLTGGGTAGHVTPHFALLPGIRERGWDVFYIGGSGFERGLVEAAGIPFKAVATGKLRRYVSFKNMIDVFKVLLGCVQAFFILLRHRPDVVFSKGGFVAVPVAAAAAALGVPVVSHESDLTPGLANKIIAKVARKIVYTFPETKVYLPPSAEHVGTPVRAELFSGDAVRGLKFCGFHPEERLPTFLVMGGSQGAQRINEALLGVLPWLMSRARVIHLTGKGKSLPFNHERYRGFEFINAELSDLFAAADFFVSRSGANSIFELVALRKPMLLIPLEQGSRGDQVVNADNFVKKQWASVLREKDLTKESFHAALEGLERDAEAMRTAQASYSGRDAAEKILAVIERVACKA